MATIRKRGKSYEFRVSSGYDISGRQIRKNMTWTPSAEMTQKQADKEANRQAVIFENMVTSGQTIDSRVKFYDFAELWIRDYAEKQLAPKTVFRYKSLLDTIYQYIGNLQLNKVQPHHLLSLYNNLQSEGVRKDIKYSPITDFRDLLKAMKVNQTELSLQSGVSITTIREVMKGNNISAKNATALSKSLKFKTQDIFKVAEGKTTLSSRTILHHHRLICSILNTAVEWQVLNSNPAERVKPPKVTRKEAKYLNEEEAKLLIKALDEEPIQLRTMIIFLIYSGLRRGELCGLKWSDIDFEKRLLKVERTIQYLPGKGVFETTPKTLSSNRVLKLSSISIALLKEYKVWQSNEKIRVMNLWEDNGFIFTSWNGKPLHPDTITGWFSDFIKRKNLPAASIHSLRHTNATLMIAGGTDIRTVSHRLGHAQTSTTANIYAHALQSADAIAADTLEDILEVKGNRLKSLTI